jgi:hypothetical protein
MVRETPNPEWWPPRTSYPSGPTYRAGEPVTSERVHEELEIIFRLEGIQADDHQLAGAVLDLTAHFELREKLSRNS